MTPNILIVDDNPANLRLLREFLVEQKYRVRPAITGQQAITAAKASPPDLILLDINMPEMNGYEVCQHLKADPTTAHVPIIFISALDKTEDKVRAFTEGGVDYITKPIKIEEVHARVKTHLRIIGLQRNLEERNRQLNSFGRMVAHDVKSPLMTIMMAADLMRLDPAERTSENLEHVKNGARKIDGIVEGLFLLASIGRDDVERHTLDTGELVQEAIDSLAVLIEDSGATIHAPAEWPAAEGYSPWVLQIWANYISNAIRYGGEPPVIHLGAEPWSDNTVRFWVSDNGMGIPEDKKESIFGEFTRLGNADPNGHGLGLSIIKKIVGKLGGEVGVESIPGNGSRFFFTLAGVGAVAPKEAEQSIPPMESIESVGVRD